MYDHIFIRVLGGFYFIFIILAVKNSLTSEFAKSKSQTKFFPSHFLLFILFFYNPLIFFLFRFIYILMYAFYLFFFLFLIYNVDEYQCDAVIICNTFWVLEFTNLWKIRMVNYICVWSSCRQFQLLTQLTIC